MGSVWALEVGEDYLGGSSVSTFTRLGRVEFPILFLAFYFVLDLRS